MSLLVPLWGLALLGLLVIAALEWLILRDDDDERDD